MEKTIHVDAYYRQDGTFVREHERHLDSNSAFQNIGGDENPGLFDNLKEILAQSKSRENELLEQLSQIGKGNQADLLKEYAELKEKNLNDEHTLRIIEYMQSTGMKEARKNKKMLDIGIKILGHGILDDAGQLWNFSAHGFENNKAKNYIAKNGAIFSNIGELPVSAEIKKAVRNKVKQQINKDNLIGVMFHINSAIAKNIAKDRDFENVINENFTQLSRGEHVNTSLSFDHDVNLHNALGKVDILDMHINNDGNIETYVLDTYDFNKGSSHWTVQKAHSAQEHHLISNYYTLTKVVKPL